MGARLRKGGSSYIYAYRPEERNVCYDLHGWYIMRVYARTEGELIRFLGREGESARAAGKDAFIAGEDD